MQITYLDIYIYNIYMMIFLYIYDDDDICMYINVNHVSSKT
jgi:hypothetical protein